MGVYMQLTRQQRYQIYTFKKAGLSKPHIASEIGDHNSAVSLELMRNRCKKGYRPKQVYLVAVERRRKVNRFVKMIPQLIVLIKDFIRQDFSCEQVSGFQERKHDI